MTATPADVPTGHVVRVLVFRQFHYSPVMSPGEALQVAEKLEQTIEAAGGTYALVPFQLADGAVTRLRARSVVDITTGPLHVLRAQEPSNVQVHLHTAVGDVAAEVPTAPIVGTVPTPLALTGRRRPR